MKLESRTVDIAAAAASEADAAVVIDVLRAFTVAPMIAMAGAKSLWLAPSDEAALQMKTRLGPHALAIKDGPPVNGFDLCNSPGQVTQTDLRDRPVVQCTLNGTRGVLALTHVPRVWAASFVNAPATAAALRASGARRIVLVATGDNGLADEDLACAEWITAAASRCSLPIAPLLDRVRTSTAAQALERGLDAGFPGVSGEDVSLAAALGSADLALERTMCEAGVCLTW